VGFKLYKLLRNGEAILVLSGVELAALRAREQSCLSQAAPRRLAFTTLSGANALTDAMMQAACGADGLTMPSEARALCRLVRDLCARNLSEYDPASLRLTKEQREDIALCLLTGGERCSGSGAAVAVQQ